MKDLCRVPCHPLRVRPGIPGRRSQASRWGASGGLSTLTAGAATGHDVLVRFVPTTAPEWLPQATGSDLPVTPTRVVETHVSTLFFVGNRVYKLRKPVQFNFLDFGLRSTRLQDCQREVALNRRLAPDVYLGVADLVMDGELIDHMVVMRRMPDERRLAELARQGAGLDRWLQQVAETLVSFHRQADRSPEISVDATADALDAIWRDSFLETEPFVGAILEEDMEHQIRALVPRWIRGRKPLLDARIDLGCVCDGHGDLQAEDIFCLDDGVRILDCVEFSDRLRHCDVCSDVTFLAMDLERLGCPDAASRFLADYQELAGNRFPRTLAHHYSASHAYVRAMVACLRSDQQGDAAHSEARKLQALALDHLRRARVRLVLVGGMPGCGKSTLASGLSASTGWPVLRSDEIRSQVAATVAGPSINVATVEYRQGRYHPKVTSAVYQEMLRQAEEALGLGESVVLDASWVDAAWRDAARSVAERTESDLVELRCLASPEDAADRIIRRLSEHSDISEATPEIARMMSQSMEPWPCATVIDTSQLSPDDAVSYAQLALSDA
jgi:aminoglycoside phosphotransferase family enzyme/predicted kinase